MSTSDAAVPNPLGTEKISRLIMKFSIPAIISLLVGALYNIVDQIFIGHSDKIGMLGIAATNVAFPLSTICIATSLLFGVGGAANFSLSLGHEDEKRASYSVGNAITALVVTGVAICTVVLIFLHPMLVAFGATEKVMPFATTYTSITTFGIPFLIFSTAVGHLIRADGSPTFTMVCLMSGAVLNTILDPIFLFVFDMGIEGAAWATLLSQICTSALMLFYLLTRFQSVPLKRRHFKLAAPHIKRISSLGMAACFNQLSMLVVQIALNNVLRYYGSRSEYGSETPLACVGAITKLYIVFMSIVVGIAQGCQPINGYNYGAGQYGRVRKSLKIALMASSGISILMFVIFQTFPKAIVSIFGENDPDYINFSVRYLRIFMFMIFLNGVQPVASNFFTSIGKAKMGIFMSLTRQVLFLLPLVLILPLFFGIHGVMYAGPIADGVAFLVAIIFVYREMRILRAV